MAKKEKSMAEELNEDKALEAEQAEAEAQAKAEKEKAKKSEKRWYIVHTYSGYEK